MTRTYVVTGSASGIGKATKELLENKGYRVIGVDLKNADINADLSTAEGRAQLAPKVKELAPDGIDAILAIAGLAILDPLTVRVNYFGAIATLEGLRPLLANSKAPRAALAASFSTLQEVDDELVASMLAGDEAAATLRAEKIIEDGTRNTIYTSTKRAIAEWMREQSITPEWAGAGIPLNAVGPGIVLTPMTAEMVKTPEGTAQLLQIVPMPLNGPETAETVADALDFLTDAKNTHITGQVLFIDGGADVSIRGAKIFG